MARTARKAAAASSQAPRTSAGGAKTTPAEPAVDAAGIHTEHEDQPWTINIPDHPARTDSPEYVKSRAWMNQTATNVSDKGGFFYGPPPYQDHHGGGLWLLDEDGWFLVRNLAGMEWSSQFCAEPARVELLRQNAARLYKRFPEAATALAAVNGGDVLNTPIATAAGVAQWTDSIFNASVPLSALKHTGTLPQGGGVHYYPAPIEEIDFFKVASFNLWVTDAQGQPAAVAPVGPPTSGDGRVRVLYATPGTQLHAYHQAAELRGEDHVLPADDPLAQQAFREQTTHATVKPATARSARKSSSSRTRARARRRRAS